MLNKSSKIGTALGLLAALLAASAIHAPAQTAALTTIYSFGAASSSGANTDGASPSSLIQAKDGNFYGACGGGGANGTGTIFKITPSGAITLLYTFSAQSSSYPYANSDGAGPDGLTQASDGNLYGTCRNGGTTGSGSIFKITTGGAFTTLYSFNDADDGALPEGGLIQASDGNLYGTTPDGGANGFGTIYKVTLSGAFTTLYSFTIGSDGVNPETGLIQASDGNLYGTTFLGAGAIFKITLSGRFTTLYTLGAGARGLIQASDGNLYGVTYLGGANNAGTIYKITLSGALTTLYSFTGPWGLTFENPLVQASDGNLYGTTGASGVNGDGMIFRMSLGGDFTLLHSFSGTDGASPDGALIQASDGTLYGTTAGGGANGTGTLYALDIIPPILSSLNPTSANAAGPALTLTLKGSAFASSSTVNWTQGKTTTPLIVTFVSSTLLKASMPAALIANPGKANVSVANVGGKVSKSKPFTILVTTLKLHSVKLSKTSAGNYTASITLKNVGFLNAPNVTLTQSSLGAAATSTTLPLSLGSLAAGATTTTSLSYAGTAGSSGTSVTLKVAGTFTGGTFSGSLKVTLP